MYMYVIVFFLKIIVQFKISMTILFTTFYIDIKLNRIELYLNYYYYPLNV